MSVKAAEIGTKKLPKKESPPILREARVVGVKPNGVGQDCGTVDPSRHYTNLHVVDGTSRIAALRVGNDADDPTPAQKLFVEDHLGSCAVTVTATGNRISLEEYYPFGETSFGGYAKKRYRFNGKEKDGESGLYEYGQRYYAPWVCRFVSVDPVGEEYPHISSYNYASNRPVTSVDAEGLQTPDEPKVVTDASGREALIDPKAEFVEGDTAIISQEGDKFVNVTGVGLVKESLLKSQNIIPNEAIPRKEDKGSGDDKGRWFEGLFDWIPDLQGSGDQTGAVTSGLTHVNDDATEIDNSGIEAEEVEGQLEIDELQYLLRGAPGKLPFKGDNWIDALSSGTDLFNEVVGEKAIIRCLKGKHVLLP